MLRRVAALTLLAVSIAQPVAAEDLAGVMSRRVDREHRPSPELTRTRQFIFKTEAHPTIGDNYVVVTDLTSSEHLQALEKLARHHHGTVLKVDDLATIAGDAANRKALTDRLREASPRYVAIAPRWTSYRETMLLAMWQVLAELDTDPQDTDPQLDAFPGLLLAPTAQDFEALIERSIHHKPQASSDLRPFLIAQVSTEPAPVNGRAMQKVDWLRGMFEQQGLAAPSLLVRQFRAEPLSLPASTKSAAWGLDVSGPRQVLNELQSPIVNAMDEATLLILFGHGVPGKTCSLDVNVFDKVRMTNKIVLCGSCYSAAAPQSDFENDDGPEIRNDRPRFAFRSIAGGATVVYGHMRENGGFPEMFPVFEAWMHGLSVGEAYQRQVNALMSWSDLRTEEVGLSREAAKDKRAERDRNELLYVVIGDPALTPFRGN
jgi:hypothetical protein